MLYSRQLNRASGCNFNNPLLTASVSDAGYMGIARSSPTINNRGAVADSAIWIISIFNHKGTNQFYDTVPVIIVQLCQQSNYPKIFNFIISKNYAIFA